MVLKGGVMRLTQTGAGDGVEFVLWTCGRNDASVLANIPSVSTQTRLLEIVHERRTGSLCLFASGR